MKTCANCDHPEFSHSERVIGTTPKRACNVAGCECVR